jgi:hypothetical protein
MNLLPSLPKEMPRGTIRGILARGQITVDRLSWDKPGGTVDLELTSGIDQTITLCLPHAKTIHDSKVVGAVVANSPLGCNFRVLRLPAGISVSLQLSFENPDNIARTQETEDNTAEAN